MRTADHPDVEAALIKWHRMARDRNVPISGHMLQSKAIELSEELGVADFKCSLGWLTRFKQRHNISYRVICGEAKSVSVDQMAEWKDTHLPSILKKYSADDIYNADETGLFYRLLPNKSLVEKSDQCSGGKQSKERLTVMVCANMSGTDKVPIYVIGKSAKPRCFKNAVTAP